MSHGQPNGFVPGGMQLPIIGSGVSQEQVAVAMYRSTFLQLVGITTQATVSGKGVSDSMLDTSLHIAKTPDETADEIVTLAHAVTVKALRKIGIDIQVENP